MAKKNKKSKKAAASGPVQDVSKRGRWVLVSGIAMLALVIVFILPGSRVNATPRYTFEVIKKLPHDRDSFTQGFLFHKGYFYESTGRRGKSKLLRIDADSGLAVQELSLEDRYFGEGLTFAKGVLVQLTWQQGKAFIYNSDTFEKLREYDYPGEGWGLTHDGHFYVMSDGSNKLHFLDSYFKQHRILEVFEGKKAVTQLNELEFVDGEIWANVWQTWEIVRIDPATGQVVGRIDLRGILTRKDRYGGEDYLNGIAHDPESGRLWVTGKNYGFIYEIQIKPEKGAG